MDKYEKEAKRISRLKQKRIERIYEAALKEAASLGLSISDLDSKKPFKWTDYPETRKRLNKLIAKLRKDLRLEIISGIDASFELSDRYNKELFSELLGKDIDLLDDTAKAYYFTNTSIAQKAFKARVTSGMNLSKRVWNLTDKFRTELELGLDVGIEKGKSAASLARELKQYLNNPDVLFRRVRNKNGNLVPSKAAKAFKSGKGVYKSSYKNALRLARNEINMAYRSANQTRWLENPSVVGIEIVLGNNENHCPMCVKLKGLYPKDFIFNNWHVSCFCSALPILKTKAEQDKDFDRIINGKEPLKGSKNTVKTMPKQFKEYIKANRGRLEKAQSKGTLGYIFRDNMKYWN